MGKDKFLAFGSEHPLSLTGDWADRAPAFAEEVLPPRQIRNAVPNIATQSSVEVLEVPLTIPETPRPSGPNIATV